MLSAVKMEGHELPEWSGGGYYGESEVRARGAAAPVPTAVSAVHLHGSSMPIVTTPASKC